jgi:hypothetical protein
MLLIKLKFFLDTRTIKKITTTKLIVSISTSIEAKSVAATKSN